MKNYKKGIKMKNNDLDITEVKVFPLKDSLTNLKANVKVVINECLVLSGLKIMKGQFGHFLSFPNQSPGSPYKYYDTSSIGFRKKMQTNVLQEYVKVLGAVSSQVN